MMASGWIGLGLGLLLAASGADAQQICVKVEALDDHLATAYGERQAWIGQMPANHTIVLYLSPNRHSWTMAVLLPDGTTACISAAGDAWAPTDEPPKKPEERS
jgi:hypothetical protein